MGESRGGGPELNLSQCFWDFRCEFGPCGQQNWILSGDAKSQWGSCGNDSVLQFGCSFPQVQTQRAEMGISAWSLRAGSAGYYPALPFQSGGPNVLARGYWYIHRTFSQWWDKEPPYSTGGINGAWKIWEKNPDTVVI